MNQTRHSFATSLGSAHFLVRAFAYWIALFASFRLIFILINFRAFPDWALAARGPFEGLSLDASMAGWFCLFSWVLLTAGSLLPFSIITLHRLLGLGLTLLYGLIAIGEAAVYSEWKSKLNYKVLSVFLHPTELMAIAKLSQIIEMVAIWLIPAAFGFALWVKFVEPTIPKKSPQKLRNLSLNSLIVFSMFLPLGVLIRGGIGNFPISMAKVYYTNDQACNDLAVNPAWNMFFQISNSWVVFSKGNPFEFMPITEARQIVTEMHASNEKNPTTKKMILTTERPNIVFLILESWSGDMISSIQSGPEEFTPEFHALEQEGILFTSFRANGNRSQQGLTSLMNGFPALGLVAASDDLSFISRLPGLGHRLNKIGYSSSFIYGGELSFGNITAVVTSAGFDKIRSGEKSFPANLKRGLMGVQDGEIIDEVIAEGDRLKEPFFLTQFTLSSHTPYDFPKGEKSVPSKISTGDLESQYPSSIRYTDAALGKFFKRARTRPWFKNTLFVLVADHGHGTWRDLPNWHPEFRRIPLLFAGPVIKKQFKGSQQDTIGSQIDVAATVLGQLNQPINDFQWSTDLFAEKQKRFAQYELNYGFGLVTRDGAVVYDKTAEKTILSTMSNEKVAAAIKMGKAYTQCSMQTFIDGTWCGVKNTLGTNN